MKEAARKALRQAGQFRSLWFEKEQGFIVYGRSVPELSAIMKAIDSANQSRVSAWSVGTSKRGRVFKVWFWAPLRRLERWAETPG